MTGKTASQAFVDAVEAIVPQEDHTDTVARLLDNRADVTGAAAVGLLVKDGRGQLEVLSATSHQVAELELYQMLDEASDHLGNTPTVARAAYVDPRVVEQYEHGHTITDAVDRVGTDLEDDETRAAVERSVNRLLDQDAR